MDRRGIEFIKWAKIQANGDEELGIKPYNQQITINMVVEDQQDREKFRKNLADTFATVVGADCRVIFDCEDKTQGSAGGLPPMGMSNGMREPNAER
jgi:hypothetical protein